MKVAILYRDALQPGGYPVDVRMLSSSLAWLGVEVVLLAEQGKETGGLTDLVERRPLADFRNVAARSDLLHIFGLLIPSHGLIAARLKSNMPVAASTLAHLMPHAMRKRRMGKEVYLAVLSHWLRRATFHTFGPAEEKSLLHRFGKHTCFQAPLGVYPRPAFRLPEKAHRMGGSLRLLFFGRNDVYQKGIDVLLRGFRMAVEGGAETSLTIAGQPWLDSSDWLSKFIRQYRLEDRAKVLGSVSEQAKWELYASADFLVFLSRWDGPPRPVREAIAAGLPVIVSPETNMGHLVELHGAGVQVALDPKSVAEVIGELACKPRGFSRYSRGVIQLRETLHWDKVAGIYLDAYQRILGGP